MRLFLFIFALLNSMFLSAQGKSALLVGISDYPKTNTEDNTSWNSIHGANDTQLVGKILKAQNFKVKELTNKDATANNIRIAIQELISKAENGDTIYLHFSCHGQPFEDLNGDEEDGWDESIIPYDASMHYQKGIYEGENHITDDELHSYLSALRKAIGINGFVCVVIDACHSGGSSRGEETEEDDDEFIRGTKQGFSSKGTDFRPRINASGNFHISKDNGSANILILEACRSYQSNYEIKLGNMYYGPLSYYVSQVLSKHYLSTDIGWVLEVKKLMGLDGRLTRQNMVYETSL